MPNIQVTHDNDQNNARRESSIAVNPNNTLQVVGLSKKFVDIATYNFSLAAVYSADGGQTWQNSAALVLPDGATQMSDPTLARDDSGNVFIVGLPASGAPPAWDGTGIVVYKSGDGGTTWSEPLPIHNSPLDDKQWAAGDSNPASPFHGNVYAVWDDGAQNGIVLARTTDHGTTWTGPCGAEVGPTIADGSYYPEIDVSNTGDIYVVSTDRSVHIQMQISTDGGDTFQPTIAPATGIAPLEASLSNVHGYAEFPGGTFRVITDPTVCALGQTVLVAWADYREGASRIYYARSLDRGSSWTTGASGQPLLGSPVPASFQHFFPQIVVNSGGVFGCVFYEFGTKQSPDGEPGTQKMLIDVILALSVDGGLTFTTSKVTDRSWDPTLDAPLADGLAGVTFIGDYFGLTVSQNSFLPLWTDTRTGVQELWTDVVAVPAQGNGRRLPIPLGGPQGTWVGVPAIVMALMSEYGCPSSRRCKLSSRATYPRSRCPVPYRTRSLSTWLRPTHF